MNSWLVRSACAGCSCCGWLGRVAFFQSLGLYLASPHFFLPSLVFFLHQQTLMSFWPISLTENNKPFFTLTPPRVQKLLCQGSFASFDDNLVQSSPSANQILAFFHTFPKATANQILDAASVSSAMDNSHSPLTLPLPPSTLLCQQTIKHANKTKTLSYIYFCAILNSLNHIHVHRLTRLIYLIFTSPR